MPIIKGFRAVAIIMKKGRYPLEVKRGRSPLNKRFCLILDSNIFRK